MSRNQRVRRRDLAYTVKEIRYTLQGEGTNAGRPVVLCRFAGCNLRSGRERDRATARCAFCDTDFVGVDGPGGGRFDTPRALAEAVGKAWLAPASTGWASARRRAWSSPSAPGTS